VKVLFACHRVPYPPKRGGKIRPFNIIRHLASRGHEVTVASLARSVEELDEAKKLSEYCETAIVEVLPDAAAWAQTVARLPTFVPSSFGYFHSRKLLRRIAAERRRKTFGLAFAHCSSAAPYIEEMNGPLKVLDYGDIDSQKWREYASHRAFPLSTGYWLEAVKLERRERQLSRNFDLCTCTTRAELASLKNLGVTTAADWFPNGVDTEFFSPSDGDFDPDLISFVGRMDYFPNQQAVLRFCSDALPSLQRLRPALRFAIVGADPPEKIRALGRRHGVGVTGSVPDVRPFVRRSAMTIAPLEIARGTQNKILESMALGVPVICSRQALGGVDAVSGEHLLSADSIPQWISEINGLLGDARKRNRLALAGRERVISHHSWASSMSRLDDLLRSAADEKDRTGRTQ